MKNEVYGKGHVSKGSLSFSAFKPKTVPFSEYEKQSAKVGILVGRATVVFEKTDDRSGTTYTGLKGAFKAIPGDDASPASANSISSGVLYMPDSWMQPIIDALKEAGDGATVQFVYEVRLARRGEQDYAWEVVDLQPAKSVDPLAELLKGAMPALEDKSGAKGKAA